VGQRGRKLSQSGNGVEVRPSGILSAAGRTSNDDDSVSNGDHERLTRTDLYTLHYEATIDDPAAYIAPWKVRFDVTWDPNGQIQEYICQENNLWKDRVSGNSRIHLDSR
jgi:hypothetical protein